MGSPPEQKTTKSCSSSLILTVFGLCILALIIGAGVSFLITKKIYNFEDDYSSESSSKNLGLPIEELLLPSALAPNNYELSIKAYIPGYEADIPTEKNLTFEGQVIIDIEVRQTVRQITLNAKNISNVNATCTANGKPLKVESITQLPMHEKIYFVLNDTITPGQKVLLTIHYTGEINSDLGGMYQTRYTSADGRERIAAVTQMQPMSARKLVPCFDEPAFKANWTVTVMHPKGTKAISNGIENGSSSDLNEGFLVSHFETTPKMSSYLLAIFISEFEYIEGKTSSGIRFRIWSRPEAKNQTKFALDSGIKCLQFYENYYEIPFPLKKQDMVALPDFAAGAMENWGLITYRENALLYDEKLYKPSEKLRVTSVIAHELAHQWFGNLVTMRWWNDLWLNEGFATLVEYMGADEISSGNFKMKDYFMVDAMTDAFRDDQMASGHPLTHKIQYQSEIDESFDGITYQKGASVLNMIGDIMGKQNFRSGLRAYLKAHAYSNSTSTDLLKALDDAVVDTKGPFGEKLNVTTFARKWTHQMGFPYLYLDKINGTHLEITQKRFKLNPQAKEKEKFAKPEYNFKWDIPVWIQVGKAAPDMKWLPANGTLIIPKSDQPIILNADGYAFVRSHYRREFWEQIFNQLKKDHSVFSQRTRFMLVSDAFAMAEIGELDYEQLFDLFDYLTKDNEFMPWSAFRLQFKSLLSYFGTTPSSKLGEAYFARLLETPFNKTSIQRISENYLNDEKFFENLHEAGIYLSYCDANKNACKKELREMYESKVFANCKEKDSIASQCNTVAAPLRGVVYCRAVEDGDEVEFEKIMELYKNEPVQVEKAKLQDALACSKSTRTLKSLLAIAVDRSTNIFRFQDVSSLFYSVANNPNGKEVVYNFLLENWDEILNSFSEQHDVINRIISNSATGIQSLRQIEQLKQFRKTATNAGIYDALFVQTMAAEQRLMWLDKNGKTLENLFKKRV